MTFNAIAMMFVLLVWGHYLGDYAFQSEYLATSKNRHTSTGSPPWWQAMSAHCAIHAGLVALFTGLWWLAIGEFIAHFIIDDHKCSQRISFNQDQAAHLSCKAIWLIFACGYYAA